MSGAVRLGAGGVQDGVARLRSGPGWAALDPDAEVAELAARLGDGCAGAAHAEEIAALLESEGLTDEQITGRYRHRDLFSLAEALFARVPRAHPEPEPAPDPWRTGLLRCVLRGLTFALPGVAYLLGARWAGGPAGPFGVTAAVAGWAAAALVGWGWNQALAHRAGLLLLARRPRDAARCLLAGGALGVLPAAAAALVLTGTARPAAPLFALGQALYTAAATALLVLGRERLLLQVLAPLVPAAALGTADLPSAVPAALLSATVAAAVAAAVRAGLRAGDGSEPRRRGAAGARAMRLPRRPGAAPRSTPAPSGESRPRAADSTKARARWLPWRQGAAPHGAPGPARQPGGEPVRPAADTGRDGAADTAVRGGHRLRRLRRALRPGGGTPRRAGSGGRADCQGGAADRHRTPAARLPRRPRRSAARPSGLARWLRADGPAAADGRSALAGGGRVARLFRPARQGEAAPVPLGRSVPLGVGGLAAGVLVVGAALTGELVGALTVSMGVAEWLLFRFRSRCLDALRATGVAERLLARSWRVLARCLGGYAGALALLAGVESAVLPGSAAWDAPHLGVLLALGCALWLALLLQSCGRPWTSAAALSAAAATALALSAAHIGTPGTAFGLSSAGAAAVLLAAATTVTARVTTHR
ncbi:hypothetical protein [Streptomyces sp. NRRL F-5123]|uniref:hypothetical protein n=1 Tax=Streptomyces sp. NRRL F-5123 TaxID=1463856 RepID=UPI000A7D202D|nr:hypothetical protein [Streptomyces sp. NRRL F-5123]